MEITTLTNICTIIGDPVTHSVSPERHNAAYKALGIDGEYVFIATKISSKNLENFIAVARDIGIKAMAVTMPHKIAVMQYLDHIDADAKKIGAVNTVINSNGKLKGFNTDWFGIAEPLNKVTTLTNKKIAILGAGATARSATFACRKHGAKVKIYNRTLSNAKRLALDFSCAYAGLENIAEIKNMDIIINTTSVGFDSYKSLVDKKFLTQGHIVFDVIPNNELTKLLNDAKEKGAKIIDGREMGLYQAVMQFELYTGKKAPIDVMRNAIM